MLVTGIHNLSMFFTLDYMGFFCTRSKALTFRNLYFPTTGLVHQSLSAENSCLLWLRNDVM